MLKLKIFAVKEKNVWVVSYPVSWALC